MSHTPNEVALKLAVEALYFHDSSDYEGALWGIVHALGGMGLARQLVTNPRRAFKAVQQSPEKAKSA